MGAGKRLNEEELRQIKTFKIEGLSNREIARRINRSHNVVNSFLNNSANYGKNQKGGIQTATSKEERLNIEIQKASNSTLSARKIAAESGISASVRTIQRIIGASPNPNKHRLKRNTKNHTGDANTIIESINGKPNIKTDGYKSESNILLGPIERPEVLFTYAIPDLDECSKILNHNKSSMGTTNLYCNTNNLSSCICSGRLAKLENNQERIENKLDHLLELVRDISKRIRN